MLWGKPNPKILIVEDRESNHKLFRDAFEEVGFEVKLRSNVDGDFIDEVSAFAPSIISMDLMIGEDGAAADRDGFDAIRMLKGDVETVKIPVIILTNFFEESKVNEAKELGAVDFINLQGQSMPVIARTFKSYVDSPRKYKPTHPAFRE